MFSIKMQHDHLKATINGSIFVGGTAALKVRGLTTQKVKAQFHLRGEVPEYFKDSSITIQMYDEFEVEELNGMWVETLNSLVSWLTSPGFEGCPSIQMEALAMIFHIDEPLYDIGKFSRVGDAFHLIEEARGWGER